jgi:hypothetical protein
MTIDRASRDRLSLIVRRFAAGRLCADDVLEQVVQVDRTNDKVVEEVARLLEEIASENDFDDGQLRGRCRLNRYGRRVFAKHWLLLRSDAESFSSTEWAVFKPLWDSRPRSVFSRIANSDLCGARRTHMKLLRSQRRLGSARRVWPFATVADLHAAQRRHFYFSGATPAARKCLSAT